MLTTDIYLDMTENVPPGDLGYSSAFSIVCCSRSAGVLIAFYARIARHASRYHTLTGRGFRSRQFDLRARPLCCGGAAILLQLSPDPRRGRAAGS